MPNVFAMHHAYIMLKITYAMTIASLAHIKPNWCLNICIAIAIDKSTLKLNIQLIQIA